MAKTELEKDIEADGVAWAYSQGWWSCKFTSPNLRGVPDRLFIRRGKHVFVEVKRPGEEPTPQQQLRAREMKLAGAEVYWVDTLEGFKKCLR
jgi:hypothetical protein